MMWQGEAMESQPPSKLGEVYIAPAPFKDMQVQTEVQGTPVEVGSQTDHSEMAV